MSNPNLGAPQPATNYLVPSSGGTHFVPVSGVFGGTPFIVDFRQFTVDQFPFNPQGVFIDNSQGTGDLQVAISPGGWVIDCPAGARMSTSYPAPNGQSCSITGNGQATVIFVDFPVLPNAGAVTVLGTVNVDVVGPNPLPVSVPASVAGVPYQESVISEIVTPFHGNIFGAGLTNTIVPAANAVLKKLCLSFSGDAHLAAAGEQGILITLNGVTIFNEVLYLPIAIPAAPFAEAWRRDIDFTTIGLAAGAAGTLVTTIGTALAGGVCDINAYFGTF